MDAVNSSEVVEIKALSMAAWFRLNGQMLLDRHLLPDGDIVYLFKRSEVSDYLAQRWEQKASTERALAKFSRIVSFEIRKAIAMRRSLGISPRLRSIDKAYGDATAP